MAEVISDTPASALPSDKPGYIFFHSGSTPTYRKVTTPPNAITTIPTIDITQIDSPSPSIRLALAQSLLSACSTCGFFYLTGHGLSQGLQNETFNTMKKFFALDLETKMSAHVQLNPAIRGYEPMGETRLDPSKKADLKEAFTIGDCPLEPEQSYVSKTGSPPPSHLKRPQNLWPSTAPWFRAGLYKYYNAILPLSLKLVRLLALGMGIDEEEFLRDYFRFPITGMRPLRYPALPEGGEGIGLGAHSDFSYLTLVLQQPPSSTSSPSSAAAVAALEVLTPTGQWIPVPPKPNAFVCNVGQYLEKQSNGRFLAAVHRVVSTGVERLSLPFFLTMDPGADVRVLVDEGKGEGRKFEDFNVGDLYIRRVLPARGKHPTSIKYRDVPEGEWKYDMLLE